MAEPAIECPVGMSDTGAYRIAWHGPAGATYRLVERSMSGQTTLYQGTQRASTVTGRPPGQYRYLVGAVNGTRVATWSAPCLVRVHPPSLALAGLLFALGFVVCLATVVVIIRGHRAHRRGEIG